MITNCTAPAAHNQGIKVFMISSFISHGDYLAKSSTIQTSMSGDRQTSGSRRRECAGRRAISLRHRAATPTRFAARDKRWLRRRRKLCLRLWRRAFPGANPRAARRGGLARAGPAKRRGRSRAFRGAAEAAGERSADGQSRSKKTQPRAAWLPFVSVISELREIMSHQKRRSPAFSLLSRAAACEARRAVSPFPSARSARGCGIPRTAR